MKKTILLTFLVINSILLFGQVYPEIQEILVRDGRIMARAKGFGHPKYLVNHAEEFKNLSYTEFCPIWDKTNNMVMFLCKIELDTEGGPSETRTDLMFQRLEMYEVAKGASIYPPYANTPDFPFSQIENYTSMVEGKEILYIQSEQGAFSYIHGAYPNGEIKLLKWGHYLNIVSVNLETGNVLMNAFVRDETASYTVDVLCTPDLKFIKEVARHPLEE